jgi:hypothetical protein
MNIKAVTLFAAIASALAAIGYVYNDVRVLMIPRITLRPCTRSECVRTFCSRSR